MEYTCSISEVPEPLKRPSPEDRCSLVGFNDRLISQRRVNIDRCSRERLFGSRANRESSCLYLLGAPHQSSATFTISSRARRNATPYNNIPDESGNVESGNKFLGLFSCHPLFWETTKRPSIPERRYVVSQLLDRFSARFQNSLPQKRSFLPIGSIRFTLDVARAFRSFSLAWLLNVS